MRLMLTAILLWTAADCQAAEPWTKADYGPALSLAMDANGQNHGDVKTIPITPESNYVFRARVISLNPEKSANICFDTELLRVASAWTGGYLDWEGANKNMGPGIPGTIHFTTPAAPGWAYQGKWDDPRHPKEGPLPREWAKYRGLYLHGLETVLSYTVGDCEVLEKFGTEREGDNIALTRTLRLGPTATPQALLVLEQKGGQGKIYRLNDQVESAWMSNGQQVLVAAISGDAAGCRFETVGGRVHLQLPASDAKRTLKLVVVDFQQGDPAGELAVFLKKPADLTPLTRGGPGRWQQVVETQGVVAEDNAGYVVDDITAPVENPWNSHMRFGGLDFFRNGDAAVSTWDGDVWIVSGLDRDLKTVRWKRFATGLHQPLGLKIVDDVVYTAGRDQLTKLVDLNGDGEADFYQNFNNDAGLTPQRHEFVMDLQTDAAGNFYYCRSGHYVSSQKGQNCCIMKVSPDGSKLEVFAKGFREPNGLSIGPDGEMTVGDNEGDGVPATPIYHLQAGADYGFNPELKWNFTKMPMVWLPKTVDGSAGTQVWVNGDQFGPLQGGLLHTSYGHCRLFNVLIDRHEDAWQAAVVEFPLQFSSGIMRARFRPQDGQLYLCGLRGWGTTAAKDGQFCRVRYTGQPVHLPTGFQVTDRGIQLTFGCPLDEDSATDDQNWGGEWADAFTVPGRKRVRKTEVFIEDIQLMKNGRTLEIELEDIQPVTNFTLEYNIQSADGAPLKGTLYITINAMPE